MMHRFSGTMSRLAQMQGQYGPQQQEYNYSNFNYNTHQEVLRQLSEASRALDGALASLRTEIYNLGGEGQTMIIRLEEMMFASRQMENQFQDLTNRMQQGQEPEAYMQEQQQYGLNMSNTYNNTQQFGNMLPGNYGY